jgi:hypothetical protein
MCAPLGPPTDEAHARSSGKRSPNRFLNLLTADLSGAQDQHEASKAQDLPLPSQGPVLYPPQSGLVHRHQLHPHASGVSLPSGHHGLAQSESAQLAAVEFHGRKLLRRGSERGMERLWRSLKYECVSLNAFDTGSEARKGIGAWISYYNVSATPIPSCRF